MIRGIQMIKLEEYGFKGLTVKDKELFSEYYNKMNGNWASSVSFLSMLAWNHSIKIYHRILGDYICCLAHETIGDRRVLLPLIGHYESSRLELCMEELKDIMEELGLPIIFTDVSEWMLPYYRDQKSVALEASYDLSLSDYIYKAEDFVQSLNSQSNRYDYNYFIRKYNPELILLKNENPDPYMEFLSADWCTSHDCSYCSYGCLLDSLKITLEAMEEAGGKGIAVYVDQQIAGYTIVTCEGDQLIYQFKKGIHKYRGINVYLHKQCYDLFGTQTKYINYTEDMNIEGLRLYKQRLAKYELYHKYELRAVNKA
jgi:hypothetical protein